MTTEQSKKQILDQVTAAIDSLRFGSIEITVHEGRVIQIEKREKVRFTDSTNGSIKPTANTAAKT